MTDLADPNYTDENTDAADKRQAKQDEIVSDYWRDSGYVEDIVSENADLIEKMAKDCESGAYGQDELGERLLSMINYHLELKAETEL